PIEPVFSGQFFFRSFDPNDAGVDAATIMISKGRGYLPDEYTLKTIWNNNYKHLTSNDAGLGLVTKTGSHRYFPFDYAQFDFEITINPPRNFSTLRIVNRVAGFIVILSE